MIRMLESALALVIFSGVAFTQTTDVDGWKGAKWGMTLTQVTAVIAYKLEPDPHSTSARAPAVYRTTEPFEAK